MEVPGQGMPVYFPGRPPVPGELGLAARGIDSWVSYALSPDETAGLEDVDTDKNVVLVGVRVAWDKSVPEIVLRLSAVTLRPLSRKPKQKSWVKKDKGVCHAG